MPEEDEQQEETQTPEAPPPQSPFDIQISIEEILAELRMMGHGERIDHAIERIKSRRLEATIRRLEVDRMREAEQAKTARRKPGTSRPRPQPRGGTKKS